MAGKVKNLLEDIARKSAANTSSPFCVGNSLTIADIQVSKSIALPIYSIGIAIKCASF